MEKQNKIGLSILILCMFLMVVPAMAADWPMWRNNASNTGASGETINLPLIEKWHSTAPLVEENGAVVVNGIAYMSATNGFVYAFDVATGFTVAGFPVTTSFNYGTPAVDRANGKIYVLAGSTLYAFNLNGSSAWTIAVGVVGNNYNQGPIIDEGYVYIKAGGFLRKYDAAGVLQWSSAAAGGNTQPSIMGGYVYSNSEGGQIQKFDKSTGIALGGAFPIATGFSQASLSTDNGKIFHKADVLYAYNADTGALLWSQPAGGQSTYSDSPAVLGGVVYVYGWDGKVYAFNENTGATMAGFPSVALNNPSDRNWSSPAIVGDKILIGAGTTQKLKVLGAAGTASAGQVLEEHLTFSKDPQGFDLVSPVISDGWVLAMLDGGGLYAFFGGAGAPPKGALVINNGATCTESQIVTLTIGNNNDPSVTEMRISEDPFFTGVPWVSYSPTTTFTLSAGFGTKTVYAQLKNSSGQLSNVFTDQIDYLQTCGPKVCDVNGDGKVDRNDINIIFAARGQRVQPGDPRDLDGDGLITVNDARGCVLKCTNPNCAP